MKYCSRGNQHTCANYQKHALQPAHRRHGPHVLFDVQGPARARMHARMRSLLVRAALCVCARTCVFFFEIAQIMCECLCALFGLPWAASPRNNLADSGDSRWGRIGDNRSHLTHPLSLEIATKISSEGFGFSDDHIGALTSKRNSTKHAHNKYAAIAPGAERGRERKPAPSAKKRTKKELRKRTAEDCAERGGKGTQLQDWLRYV